MSRKQIALNKSFVDTTDNLQLLDNELFEGYSDELLTFAWISCIVFIIVGVPGNLLTIIALSRGKQTRNSTAIFIINLSSSDLLFGCFNLPLAASTFMQRAWKHSDLLCRLFPLLRYGLLAVSLFTVLLITINRYIIIAHPRQYPRIYQRRYLALMVAGTWITAFSFMIPTWRGIWGTFGLDRTIGSCSILHDKYGRSPKEFLFVAAFMLPCICIVICYARIFHLVRKAAIRTREPALSKSTALQAEHKAKHAKEQVNECKELQVVSSKSGPFAVSEYIEYIDDTTSTESFPISYNIKKKKQKVKKQQQTIENNVAPNKTEKNCKQENFNSKKKTITSSIRTSCTRFSPRKGHYVSMANTSNASSIYPGRMSPKDRRLLKMILVIFVWFVVCYLPITITKIWKGATDIHFFNISGYLLIYFTTCINPLIYVLMSSEYRRAYWNLLSCRQNEQQHQQHQQQTHQQQLQQQHSKKISEMCIDPNRLPKT